MKHRVSRNYSLQLHSLPTLSMQRPSSERQSLALWEVLGRVMTPIAWHSPSAGSCLPAEMPALVPSLPLPASAPAVPTLPNWCCPSHSLLAQGTSASCCSVFCRCCVSFEVERMLKVGTGPALKLVSLNRLLLKHT